MAKKEYTEVGTIRLGEYGLYIKLHKCKSKDSSGNWTENASGLKKLAEAILSGTETGLNLSIDKPEDEIRRFLDLGHIDDAEAEKRIANIPEWLKYKIKLVQ